MKKITSDTAHIWGIRDRGLLQPGLAADVTVFDPETIDLAVIAHVRHAYTDYDTLLVGGWDRHEARAEVRGKVDEKLGKWRPHR